jgi:hypothetical protein
MSQVIGLVTLGKSHPLKISQWRFQCGNYFESDFAVQANKMLLRKDGGFW